MWFNSSTRGVRSKQCGLMHGVAPPLSLSITRINDVMSLLPEASKVNLPLLPATPILTPPIKRHFPPLTVPLSIAAP